MADIHLTPSYLETDFLTTKDKLINLMKNDPVFRDYSYEGSNINMLLELVSYLNDLSTFYINEVAKNVYPDTANLYETTHSLVTQRSGYQPNGYISAQLDLKVTIKRWNDDHTIEYYNEGDQIYIPAWYTLDTGQTNTDNNNIYYTTTDSHTINLPLSGDIDEYSFLIPIKQGEYFTGTYSGDDIIDGSIILPFKQIDMGVYPYDDKFPSSVVYVDEEPWNRVYNFYDELSGLQTSDNVYKIVYDKYKRYKIVFSSARNMPTKSSRIRIVMLNSLGDKGTLGANLLKKEYGEELSYNIPLLVNRNWTTVDTPFIINLTRNALLSGNYKFINESASIYGSSPETLEQIKTNSKKIVNTQYRNVTKTDYIADLESRTDIIKANVWGEQEENYGNTQNYNKVYICVIPKNWTTYTIPTSGIEWIDPMVPDITQTIQVPIEVNEIFQNDLKTYIEPRKIISTYEQFVLPDIVYFKFEIGILPKRLYNFNIIIADVKAKLDYYFSDFNREFNEVIDFRDIHNYILDSTITSPDNTFDKVKGIQNFVFRDIALYSTLSNQSDPMEIFELNDEKKFPMFTVNEFDVRYENLLKPIKLGLNQFPKIALDMCIFINEV